MREGERETPSAPGVTLYRARGSLPADPPPSSLG